MNEQFRGYRLVTQLAKKTKSSLYLARPITAPTEKVTIKIFDSLDSGIDQEFFYNEVDQLIQLRHPFLNSLLDGGIEQGRPYLISRYAPNGSLRQRLKSVRPLTLENSFLILMQIGQALAHTHGWNVVHAHLKPENVLFNAQDEAMLADFIPPSLFKSYFPHSHLEQEDSQYQAPEQKKGTFCRESDQYALGFMAYELLTGEPPHAATTFTEGQFTQIYPVLPSHIVPALPRYFDDALPKALANDPLERHENVAAFIEALTAGHVNVTMNPSLEMLLPLLTGEKGASPPASLLTSKNKKSSPLSPRESIAVATPPRPKGGNVRPEAQERGTDKPAPLILSQTSNAPIMGAPESAFQITQKEPSRVQTKTPTQRSRKAVLIGSFLALACVLLLSIGLLPQFLSLGKQEQRPTFNATAPSMAATKTQTQVPVAQSTITPLPTATQKARVTPSPTANVLPTATATSSGPRPTPTSGPKPTPTPICRCLLLCKC
ncbi:serine/threonine protein kinase [Ktedonobacter robiniae]|uniref:Protein kinase domain-containing protein n=1 Tax=Ktedonobacter robiniae TaxID=2778365 RepID=A0ABQ3UYV9_9CHLR|nr:serine/threonine-protein kinase [Ktedonobacter robiniae]GHO57973.1 hypothetical protein KSB_64480 [Ktedonobacter robiniae]